ncbi:unnamed protein product [Trichobilharzia szidati]|nr:unnamed protein product [Trichobilharzia szidati]
MGESLPVLFGQILAKYSDVSLCSGSHTETKFKESIEIACQLCEKAMEMVNELRLFSSNESLDDLSATEIRYLCLPALLAYFNTHKSENRGCCLRLALSLYKDFSNMCTEYSVPFPEELCLKDNQNGDNCSMTQLARKREIKIKRYKLKKSLEERLEKLVTYVDQPHVDEETKREFNLTLVQKWLCIAQDEMISLQSELDLLSKGDKDDDDNEETSKSSGTRKPFRPFILTRSAVQAAVFGAGYPSLPTMTIEEFYEQQVAAGLLPPPKPIPQNTSTGPSVRRIDPSTEEREANEKKKERQDQLEDTDDAEALSKARAFDDFKDEHRRGSGNRMNRS